MSVRDYASVWDYVSVCDCTRSRVSVSLILTECVPSCAGPSDYGSMLVLICVRFAVFARYREN